MEIRDSARKHGVVDEDIEHAVAHALVVAELDDDKTLYLDQTVRAICSKWLP